MLFLARCATNLDDLNELLIIHRSKYGHWYEFSVIIQNYDYIHCHSKTVLS